MNNLTGNPVFEEKIVFTLSLKYTKKIKSQAPKYHRYCTKYMRKINLIFVTEGKIITCIYIPHLTQT